MVKNSENKEGNHENEWADSVSNGEKTNQANFGEVDASQELLKRTWVDKPFGIDLAIGHKEDVIPVCKVEQGHSDGRES